MVEAAAFTAIPGFLTVTLQVTLHFPAVAVITAVPSGKVTYTSSNKRIATVTSRGVVKGIRRGTVTITVKCNGMTARFKVTVR